ncbi:MAG: hypothetical protein M0Z99_00510 [Betaproteobacteria bacterium]|nr:hypothetical protein [Betaproteobacteria bacterium]
MYCIDSHHLVPASPWDFPPEPESESRSRRHDARERAEWMRNLVAARQMIQNLARQADRRAAAVAQTIEATFRVPVPLLTGIAAARRALMMISAAARMARAIELRSLAAVFRRRMPPPEAATPSGRRLAHLGLTPRLLAQRPQIDRARAGC